MSTGDTPQLDRWQATYDRRMAIIEFLEATGYELCSWEEDRCVPDRRPLAAVLDEYFGIDPKALEGERRVLLDEARTYRGLA